MVIARSFWRKALVTVVAAAAFASIYEVTMLDSNYVAHLAETKDLSDQPAPGQRVSFEATAYCKGITTASGVAVQAGIAAADPALLPVGSVVEAMMPNAKYSGIYTIMDTGPSIKGRI